LEYQHTAGNQSDGDNDGKCLYGGEIDLLKNDFSQQDTPFFGPIKKQPKDTIKKSKQIEKVTGGLNGFATDMSNRMCHNACLYPKAGLVRGASGNSYNKIGQRINKMMKDNKLIGIKTKIANASPQTAAFGKQTSPGFDRGQQVSKLLT